MGNEPTFINKKQKPCRRHCRSKRGDTWPKSYFISHHVALLLNNWSLRVQKNICDLMRNLLTLRDTKVKLSATYADLRQLYVTLIQINIWRWGICRKPEKLRIVENAFVPISPTEKRAQLTLFWNEAIDNLENAANINYLPWWFQCSIKTATTVYWNISPQNNH